MSKALKTYAEIHLENAYKWCFGELKTVKIVVLGGLGAAWGAFGASFLILGEDFSENWRQDTPKMG